ncbi:MAG: hypothetical protein Tsb0014_15470 [Pleurocapsa sp.]
MIISDLNYLENVEGSVQGGSVYGKVWLRKDVVINEKTNIDIKKRINSKADIYGNASYAESLGDAYGKNSFTETFTATLTTDNSSGSYSSSYGSADR